MNNQESTIPFEETEYGFVYGAAKVTRMFSHRAKGWVCIGIETPKTGPHGLQIYVTRTGRIRIADSRGEWSPPMNIETKGSK